MKRQIFLSIILFSTVSVLFMVGCDKIPNGVVDFQSVDYKVTNVSAPPSAVYSKSDSSVVTSIRISNPSSVASVWCKVSSMDGTIDVISKVNMYDDGNTSGDGDVTRGDGIYTGKFFMSRTNPNGKYQVEYYVEDNVNQSPDNLAKVGSSNFNYDNGQNNLPPVISDLIMPQSVNRNVDFIVHLKASDENSLVDIAKVEFSLYQPDGTYLGKFPLLDDGNTSTDGDDTAGDGIFSTKKSFRTDVAAGIWKFVFQATDLSGSTSNTIIFNLTVN